MKFCADHWKDLQAGIKDRGMWHLVLQGDEELMQRVKDELTDKATDKNWDPLAAATWGIYSHALECGGLYLMGKKPDGTEYCPLCEAEERGGEGQALLWITGCLDALLQYAKDKGLMA